MSSDKKHSIYVLRVEVAVGGHYAAAAAAAAATAATAVTTATILLKSLNS